MASVQQQLPHATLTVVGDGPMRPSLVDLAGTLGVRCNFLGPQSSDQIKVLLQQATIVCVPSRTASNGDCEGLPIFLLEAQSMCVPVVGTFHAGIPEAVIHGETGLLGPEGDFANWRRTFYCSCRARTCDRNIVCGLHNGWPQPSRWRLRPGSWKTSTTKVLLGIEK